MRKMIFAAALVAAGVAQAEMDGADILKQEAARAQEIQRLQHQAELLKQRAEIARYANEIRENGGDLTDLGVSNAVREAPLAPVGLQNTNGSGALSSDAPGKKADIVPTLVQIEKDRAAFDTEGGRVSGRIGQTLPGGYRIVSLDMRDGVRLQKSGMYYDIDLAW